ncbi:unnamed protein product [Adineta ricciae]|uniref:S-phase kinase-associated protein 1 n=1 Tax=Adineta ricciae TaxID=249248 RepID=A0A815FP04_ADIRI|nr:unnamed protein product [Adineta ricciae]
MASSMDSNMIKLQSNEGDIFEVDPQVLQQSEVLKNYNSGVEDDVIPLPNVNSAILKKILQWLTHHMDDPPLTEDDENPEKNFSDISSWDQDFLRVGPDTLFELILAANYLDIKGLLDVTCKTVANTIKGRTPEEIRRQFNTKNNFTPQEVRFFRIEIFEY